ncbi:hypothetical protein D3C71_1871430 [compost metagenome]
MSGFKLGRFRSTLSRVSFNARLSFNNLQLYAGRKVDPKNLTFVTNDVYSHVLFKEIQFPFQLLFGQFELVISFVIHKYMVLSTCIQILYTAVFDNGTANRFTCTECTLNSVTVA